MDSHEKVRILAFDPGTASTGYAIIEGNIQTGEVRLYPVYGVFTSSKKDGDVRKRADLISGFLLGAVKLHKPDYIAIEDYTEQGVRSGKTYKDMSILIENMRITCRILGFEARIRTNAEWKRIATGSGGLNKRQVQHFVQHKVKGTEVLGSRVSDTHVWDAVGIGYAEFIQLQGELS